MDVIVESELPVREPRVYSTGWCLCTEDKQAEDDEDTGS
jgi:hypothetical protein